MGLIPSLPDWLRIWLLVIGALLLMPVYLRYFAAVLGSCVSFWAPVAP